MPREAHTQTRWVARRATHTNIDGGGDRGSGWKRTPRSAPAEDGPCGVRRNVCRISNVAAAQVPVVQRAVGRSARPWPRKVFWKSESAAASSPLHSHLDRHVRPPRCRPSFKAREWCGCLCGCPPRVVSRSQAWCAGCQTGCARCQTGCAGCLGTCSGHQARRARLSTWRARL